MRAQYLKFEPYTFTHLLACDIQVKTNDHAMAYIEGIIHEDSESQYVSLSLENTTVKIIAVDGGVDNVIFHGVLKEQDIVAQNGLRTLKAVISSASLLMDLTENTRTFQDNGLTYDHLLETQTSVANYPGYNYVMTVGSGVPINMLITQYKETDWEFVKRMASRFNSIVIPDYHSGGNVRYYFGLPRREAKIEMSPNTYQIKKDLSEYSIKTNHEVIDFLESDSMYYIVEDRNIYKIADKVSFMGRELYIHSLESHLVGEELKNYYTLKSQSGFKTIFYHNDLLTGASLNGWIHDVAKDIVQVRLQVDPDINLSGTRWFPYSTVYSNPEGSGWYCMPEIGDCIRLYLPSNAEDEAYVISSTNLQATDGISRTDPTRKSIKNINGKEIELNEKQIILTNNQEESGNLMKIVIDDDKGIEIYSAKNISIACEDILNVASLQNSVTVAGLTDISINQGEGTSYINLNEKGIQYEGEEVQIQ